MAYECRSVSENAKALLDVWKKCNISVFFETTFLFSAFWVVGVFFLTTHPRRLNTEILWSYIS